MTTAWGRRAGVCWALFAALLMVMGLAAPGPASARPAAEYSAPQALCAARLRPARAGEDNRAAASAPVAAGLWALAIDRPVHGPGTSIDPRGVFIHAYEATGPPTAGFSQAA